MTAPDSLPADLKEHIYRAYHAVEPYDRLGSYWVMNLEWLNEIRRLDDRGGVLYHPGLTLSAPDTLLGLPIVIRADGGVPHLEPNRG